MRHWLALILLCLPLGVAVAAIDLNTADQATLESLDGIGPVRARAIVEYRGTHGPFVSLEHLLEVKGIGPKTLERIRPQVTLTPPRRAVSAAQEPRAAPADKPGAR